MKVRWPVLQLVWLSLCACSSGQQTWVPQPSGSFAYWHSRIGDHSDHPVRRRSHSHGHRQTFKADEKPKIDDRLAIEREEAELDTLPKYSREWVARRKQIDAEEDARITKILGICSGCETDSKPN